MTKITIKSRVATMLEDGYTRSQIAAAIERDVKTVNAVIWRLKNAKRVKKYQKEYDAARYGTEEYRRGNNEYVKRHYHNDASFRRSRLDAVKRYETRKRTEAS